MVRETEERGDREDKKNSEQKQQDLGRAMEKLLEPTAVPGLKEIQRHAPEVL